MNTGNQKRVSSLFQNVHGLGDFGFQMMVNMELLFFIKFLADAMKYSPGIVGSIGLITGIFDVIWAVVAAAIVQKTSDAWGKLRPWLLYAPPIIWAFFIFQFWGFSGNGSLASFLICMGFIVSHLIWNCTYTAHIAMISAYSDDMAQRTRMSSNRMVYQAAGKILFSFITVGMIASFTASSGSPAKGYTFTAVVLTLIMVVSYIVVYILSKPYEQDRASEKQDNASSAPKTPLLESIKNTLANSQLMVLMCTDLGRCFAFYLVTSVTAFYFRVVIGNPAMMTNYLLLINFAAFGSALIAPYFAKALGKKMTYFIGSFGYAVCLLLVWMMAKTATSFMVLMVIAAALIQLAFSMGTAMFADTVVYGEWKTGINARGFIMGLYSLPIKVSIVLRAVFIAAMLKAMSYVPDAVTPEMVSGIRNLISIYPAIAIAIFGIIGLVGYKLTDKYVAQLSNEISDRKAK